MSSSTTKPDSTGISTSSGSSGSSISQEAHLRAAEFLRIGREGVREAQEESRRLGVPNVYFINGHTYYELPDGTLSLEDPYPATQAAKRAQQGSE